MKNTLIITSAMLIFSACGFDDSRLEQNIHSQQSKTKYKKMFWAKKTLEPTEFLSKNFIPRIRKDNNAQCHALNTSECGSIPDCATMENEVCSETRCDINSKCVGEEYLTQQNNCVQTTPYSSNYFCSEEEYDNVQCHTDSDCDGTKSCINFICTPKLNGCTNSDGCDEDSSGIIGTQNVFDMCATNNDCAEGLICQRNHCLPEEMAAQENTPGNWGND